ncbi:MAG: N-acetyltransferase [Flavobacteriaceae bacterium]|nr:N-acetyltransferase [Flavobacteriaceae bacterium]NNK27230.1 N-acetyltransferase [Flavobacteriaceae bacterium]NNL60359.1 N-acetyltransferase [Flavobacteriaceae bacterium]
MSAEDLIDNEFLRQYELKVDDQLMKIEYASQDRKIFLTKLEIPEGIHSKKLEEEFLTIVLQHIAELNVSVVPTSPPIAKFIRGNRKYKRMLPVGVRI